MSGESELLVHDRFDDPRRPGQVIGTTTRQGAIRKGVDVEGVLAIDTGALRICPLITPGWGRAGLAYGPYKRKDGLAVSVTILNGHNASQLTGLDETFFRRMVRWLKGSESTPVWRRLLRWLVSGRLQRSLRQFYGWWRVDARRRQGKTQMLDQNLAVGWFESEKPAAPGQGGSHFVVQSEGAENASLHGVWGDRLVSLAGGLQNIPARYVVILRSEGAAYYLGLPGDDACLRPLGIDQAQAGPVVYAGVHQSVLGQIGFRADTRVYEVRVEALAAYRRWYGTAHAADRLAGEGSLHSSPAEVGGRWRVLEGEFARRQPGAAACQPANLALQESAQPAGLVHILMDPGGREMKGTGIVWRFRDRENYWQLALADHTVSAAIVQGSVIEVVATQGYQHPTTGKPAALQVVDDGSRMAFTLNGELLFNGPLVDRRLKDGCGAGLISSDPGVLLSEFEAHPRLIPLPSGADLLPGFGSTGGVLVLSDDFTPAPAAQAADLAGRLTPVGNKLWLKQAGPGAIELCGPGAARVRGSPHEPNPGRTLYTLDWAFPVYADLTACMTPPGARRGQGEKGRGGLVFWQDPDNYIVINTWLDDHYDGASISSFFVIDGYEELYDAIWTNVGGRVTWGKAYTLRAGFDGLAYSVSVDGEPVLYRSLQDVYPGCARLVINRVGIAVNWEWGNDTGTTFHSFEARSAAQPGNAEKFTKS